MGNRKGCSCYYNEGIGPAGVLRIHPPPQYLEKSFVPPPSKYNKTRERGKEFWRTRNRIDVKNQVV